MTAASGKPAVVPLRTPTVNFYIITGNGTFDPPTGGYGDSFIKLAPSGTNLPASDYFTPYNQMTLSINDTDLGSSGVIVLPDEAGSTNHPHLITGVGKGKTFYLIDATNGPFQLGHNDSQIVQYVTTPSASA